MTCHHWQRTSSSQWDDWKNLCSRSWIGHPGVQPKASVSVVGHDGGEKDQDTRVCWMFPLPALTKWWVMMQESNTGLIQDTYLSITAINNVCICVCCGVSTSVYECYKWPLELLQMGHGIWKPYEWESKKKETHNLVCFLPHLKFISMFTMPWNLSNKTLYVSLFIMFLQQGTSTEYLTWYIAPRCRWDQRPLHSPAMNIQMRCSICVGEIIGKLQMHAGFSLKPAGNHVMY